MNPLISKETAALLTLPPFAQGTPWTPDFGRPSEAVMFAYRNSRRIVGTFCVTVDGQRAEIFLSRGPVRSFEWRWTE